MALLFLPPSNSRRVSYAIMFRLASPMPGGALCGKEYRYGGTSYNCLGSIGNDRPVLFGAVAGGAKISYTKTTFGWREGWAIAATIAPN